MWSVGSGSNFLFSNSRGIDPGRLKLPLSPEARGEFGYALTVARLTYRTAFGREFVHYIARFLEVKVSTYEGYESGAAHVSEAVLAKLLRFYMGSAGICEGLIDAYRRQYGKVIFLEGHTLAELMADSMPSVVTENLDFLRIEAEKQYGNGDLAGAYHWTTIAWETAIREGIRDASIAKLAITHARFASNRSDHHGALRVVERAIEYTPWTSEPSVRAALELSRAAIDSRASRREGAHSAHKFIEVLKLMAPPSPAISGVQDSQWRRTWYDALRSAATCYCDTFTIEDKRQVRNLLVPLQRVADNDPELGFVHESTLSRIRAILDDPDNALAEIDRLARRRIGTFADQCYHAKSKILALFRQGAEGQDRAIAESDLYARLCGEKLLFHKQETFILLASRLRDYVERQENLR